MKAVLGVLIMFILTISPLFWARANSDIPPRHSETELKSIHGETHECVATNSQEGQQLCKGLVTGKTIQVQSLKLSTHTGNWVPQTTKKQ